MFESYEISDEDDPYFIPDWYDTSEDDGIAAWPVVVLDDDAPLLWEAPPIPDRDAGE